MIPTKYMKTRYRVLETIRKKKVNGERLTLQIIADDVGLSTKEAALYHINALAREGLVKHPGRYVSDIQLADAA
jgi:hypothetical protein